MKTIDIKLDYSAIQQGIVEKKAYPNGQIAYCKTKTGNEFWFDQHGHLIHKLNEKHEEYRGYYDNGVIKYLNIVGQYEMFYDAHGLKIHKIKSCGAEEFWEYDDKNNLIRWRNTAGHERKYVCDGDGKVVSWYGNNALMNWYAETGMPLDKHFAGFIDS